MKINHRNRKGALEMSVGTMVTIVLLMVFLVLGIFFIQRVARLGLNAVDTIDSQVQSEIQKLFAEEGRKLAVYPTSRDVVVKRGDTPKGFAFSVRNLDVESADFTYLTEASDVSRCGSTFSEEDANNILLGGSGNFPLGPGDSLDPGRIVKFVVPESAPPCTIIYNLEISKNSEPYTGADVFVTIK